ncbi:DUF1254 domain-containing protein [Pseudomonas sp. H9]|uniref:DUF1254 domain-containing protein n=1 Tax=Pseudomonas sp. H9 TaxID=483968 RepID=UPI001057BC51|nr:DUF1254 domain-containing protein [Pseudomonas sp. H9]TDF78179.1 DUF1254 domain-containing protein [Pseudomonas sp. H9]
MRRLLSLPVALLLSIANAQAEFNASLDEARQIAKEAYLYGFPVVEMYKTLFTQAVDMGSPGYKAPFNQIANSTQAFTPNDTAPDTPNLDTAYSFLWMDLRSEPVVLTLPEIEDNRYYATQLIDLYTQNFAYLGTRSTGNKGGHFMIAGPSWQGPVPDGIDKVVYSKNQIVYALYRTQLFNEADLHNVRAIQHGYSVEPLSSFLDQSPPPVLPAVAWIRPQANISDSPALFRYLNFMMAFAPAQDSESELLQRFKKIGIDIDKPFEESMLDAEQYQALQAGIDDGKATFAAFKKDFIDSHKVNNAELYGSPEQMSHNYLYRYAGATLRLFGNAVEEATQMSYDTDALGQPLDAGKHTYTLRFAKGQLPPARALWSLTLYDGKTRQVVDNPLKRYLINSRMLDQLKRDPDGSLTLYLQHELPGNNLQSNWLPTPDGPFYGILRLYMPGPQVASGQWKQPLLTPTPSISAP